MSSLQADRHRILVLIKGLGIGGAERLISDGARYWDQSRFDYRVGYVLPWKNQLAEPIRQLGIEVDCLGSTRGMGPSAWFNLRRLVRDWNPSLIHAHLPSAGILARVSGAPVVYTEHNISTSYREPTRTMNRLSYRRNRAVIAVSDAVAESLRGYPGPQPRVIPNGITFQVTAEEAKAVRDELGIGTGQTLVVHVGNIRPHKGHENLIAATGLIVARGGSDVLVVSVGAEKYQGDLARVRASASEAGVSEHIRFMGRREEARAFLAAADVVVNPADFEGLPLAVLEALSLGKPVVATAVGGVPSVIVDGVTGRLVPPADPAALAEGILEAISSPAASGWGAAGAELVTREHGIERMILDYEKVYAEVLGV